MDEVKRGPGRPKGTETDDSVPLMMIARLLTDHPKLPAKTAAWRVFKGGSWGRSSEDSSIHRWQGKWKVDGAVYLQRVSDERAEAEQQRQERAVAHARRASSRTARELMADALAAGHAPGWALQKTMQEWAARDAMMRPKVADLLAVVNAMPKMTISRADLEASGVLATWTVSDAMRSVLETANATGLGVAMQKHGAMGRTLEAFTAAHMPKLPKGF